MPLTINPSSIPEQQQIATPAIQNPKGNVDIKATQATLDTPTVPSDQPQQMAEAVSQNNAQTLQVTTTKDHPHLKDPLTMSNLNAKSDLQVKQSHQDMANKMVMDNLKMKGYIDEEGQINFKQLGLSSWSIKRLHLEGNFFINKTTGQVDFDIGGRCDSKSMAALKNLDAALAECRICADRFPKNEQPVIPTILADLAGKPSATDRAVLNGGGTVQYRIGEEGNCIRAASDLKREELSVSVTDYKGKPIGNGEREQIPFSTVFGDNRLSNYQEVFARKQEKGNVGTQARTQIANAVNAFLDLRTQITSVLENNQGTPPPAIREKGDEEFNIIPEEEKFENQEQEIDKGNEEDYSFKFNNYDFELDDLKQFDNTFIEPRMVDIHLGEGLKPLKPDLIVQREANSIKGTDVQLINVLSDLSGLFTAPEGPNLEAISAKLNDLVTISLIKPELKPLADALDNLPLKLMSFPSGIVGDLSNAILTIQSKNEEMDPELLTALNDLQNTLSQLVDAQLINVLSDLSGLFAVSEGPNLEAISAKLNDLAAISLIKPELKPLADALDNLPLKLMSFPSGIVDDLSNAILTIQSKNEEVDPELLTALNDLLKALESLAVQNTPKSLSTLLDDLKMPDPHFDENLIQTVKADVPENSDVESAVNDLQNTLSQLAGTSNTTVVNNTSINVNVQILRGLDDLSSLLHDPQNINWDAINSKLNELETIASNNPELKPLIDTIKLLLSNLQLKNPYLDESLITTIRSEGAKIPDSESSINNFLNALENLNIQSNKAPETVPTPATPAETPTTSATPKNLTFSERLDNALNSTPDTNELNWLFGKERMERFMGFSQFNQTTENDSRFSVMKKYCQLADSLPEDASGDRAKRTLASIFHDNICNQAQRMSSKYINQMPNKWRAEISQQYQNYVNNKDYNGAFEFMKNTVQEIDAKVNGAG